MSNSDETKISDRIDFCPFYERFNVRFLGSALSRLCISGLLGFTFLALHYAAIGKKVFSDWSWFLALLISVTMLCLYIATATLRSILSTIALQHPPDSKLRALAGATRLLSDRLFILAGSIIGLSNCIVGYSIGLPYTNGAAVITILIGYFVAGFVGGMAVLGILGVCIIVVRFSEAPGHIFDFTAPDSCGGTLFIGQALVVFSSVTLIAGVMISVYIVETNWTGGDAWLIALLKDFWIVIPYVLSLVVLIVPAIPLHNELMKFKEEREASFKFELAKIRASLEDRRSDAAQRKELRDDYEFKQNVRKDLHRMRTWPFGTGASVTYLVIFAGNAITSKSAWTNTLSWWMKSLRAIMPW
jgi:hypothetical protein